MQREYAIVDIETTGGNASGSRITEIAILIHNGEKVIHRYETLVNPEKEIPPAIFALTGITNDMVADKPKFSDIAEEVYSLLKDRVFVAHNVNFDYSFVRHQLRECGYQWDARKLCTVRLCRKIKPGLPSYTLGNLCQYLGIELHNRHRAGGDADATAELFGLLIQWDTECVITQMLKKAFKEQRLPPNLPQEDFDRLPERAGVYYFKNQAGKVIYVGKATNIKKRVSQHFSGNNIYPQRQNFLREIHSVDYEICGTELMALLLECIEIKKYWPAYNRALKRFEPKYGLIGYTGMDGYQYLAVSKISKHFTCVEVFNKEFEGINLLRHLVQKFDLDMRFCKIGKLKAHDTSTPLPDCAEYNRRVASALQYLDEQRKSYFILDKGRSEDELSCIWVEQEHLYAMGYISKDAQLNYPEDIRDSLPRCYGNRYIMQLIENYAQRYPRRVKYVQQSGSISLLEDDDCYLDWYL